jgi:hypothetical protein
MDACLTVVRPTMVSALAIVVMVLSAIMPMWYFGRRWWL